MYLLSLSGKPFAAPLAARRGPGNFSRRQTIAVRLVAQHVAALRCRIAAGRGGYRHDVGIFDAAFAPDGKPSPWPARTARSSCGMSPRDTRPSACECPRLAVVKVQFSADGRRLAAVSTIGTGHRTNLKYANGEVLPSLSESRVQIMIWEVAPWGSEPSSGYAVARTVGHRPKRPTDQRFGRASSKFSPARIPRQALFHFEVNRTFSCPFALATVPRGAEAGTC